MSVTAGAGSAAKKSHVENQTDILSNSIDEAHSLLNNLEERMGSVLRNEPTTEKEKLNQEEEVVVAAAGYVRSQRYKAESLIVKISSIIDRLEV